VFGMADLKSDDYSLNGADVMETKDYKLYTKAARCSRYCVSLTRNLLGLILLVLVQCTVI